MRPPNSRHSDARNSHMPSLVLEMPVLVAYPWPPWTTSGSGAVTTAWWMSGAGDTSSGTSAAGVEVSVLANGGHLLLGIGRGIDRAGGRVAGLEREIGVMPVTGGVPVGAVAVGGLGIVGWL